MPGTGSVFSWIVTRHQGKNICNPIPDETRDVSRGRLLGYIAHRLINVRRTKNLRKGPAKRSMTELHWQLVL